MLKKKNLNDKNVSLFLDELLNYKYVKWNWSFLQMLYSNFLKGSNHILRIPRTCRMYKHLNTREAK